MKAMVLNELGPVESKPLKLTEITRHEISTPDEILIKIEACGVCHSQLHGIEGDWKDLGIPPTLPTVPGHEIVGKIVQVGKNVQKFREDENIIVLNRDATHIGPFPYADSQADIFFMDPPYDKKLVLATLNSLIENKWLARNALCIIELSRSETIDYSLEFKLIDARKYGKTVINILKFGG